MIAIIIISIIIFIIIIINVGSCEICGKLTFSKRYYIDMFDKHTDSFKFNCKNHEINSNLHKK